MTGDSPVPASGRAVAELLQSPTLARAFTLTAMGAVLSSFVIERTAGRVTYITIIAALCLLAVAMLVARRREVSILQLVPTSLVILLAWMLASIAWSTDPTASFGSWVATAAVALLAVTIGQVRDTLQTARSLGDVLRVMLSVSLAAEVLSGILLDIPFPFLEIQGNITQLGPVQGIFGTRNLLGFIAVIALVTFLIEYRTQSVRPGVSVFSVALAGLLAVLSDSPTVVVLAVAVAVASGVLWVLRHAPAARRMTLQWVLGAVVAVGLVIALAARDTIIAWLDASTDFSTRADLWARLLGFVRLEPVLGWGWFGPWPPLEVPFVSINFMLAENHATALNAYLDVLLQLGWLGLLLFAAFAGIALVRSWLTASERRSTVYAWPPLILVTLLVDSIFESFTLAGFGWMLLVLCAVRAGQSRSWRKRIDAVIDEVDPPSAQGWRERAG